MPRLPGIALIPWLFWSTPSAAQQAVTDHMVSVREDTTYSLSKTRLAFAGCDANKPDRELALTAWDETDHDLRIAYRDDAQEQQLTLTKSRSDYKGVPVDEFVLAQFPGQASGTNIVFRRPVEPGIALRFLEWNYCAIYGFEPGTLNILYTPAARNAAEQWVRSQVGRRHLEPTVAEGDGPIAVSDEAQNEFAVDMVTGFEQTVIEDLERQPWLLDYSMNPFPLGPGADLVALPDGVIDYRNDRTASALRVTRDIIHRAFPALTPNNYTVDIKGTSFEVTIIAPMSKIWPTDVSYRPYWLKARVKIMFWANGRADTHFDSTAFVDAREGWLPRWPGPGAPLQRHYQQFTLSSEGPTKFLDYTVLSHLQSKLYEVLVTRYHGTVFGG